MNQRDFEAPGIRGRGGTNPDAGIVEAHRLRFRPPPGGLLGIGMAVLFAAPYLAARLRGIL